MKTRLVYLLAASHSGSTLLAILLGSHPEICTVGELKLTSLGDVDRYLCSCRARIKACPFWSGIREEMTVRGSISTSPKRGPILFPARGLISGGFFDHCIVGRGSNSSGMPLLASLRRGGPASSRFHARNSALAVSICVSTGKKVIVDSSKVGIRLKYLLRNPALDVKVVRLVRDGRGVALAYVDPARFADASDPGLRGGGMGSDREDERLAHRRCSARMAPQQRGGRRDPGGPRPLPMEEHPIRGALRRPGPYAAVPVRFHRRRCGCRVEQLNFEGLHVIGNGMRLDCSRKIRLDERWRQAMSPADLRVFDSVAGSLNRKLGYL